LFLQLSSGGKKKILVDGGNRENRLDECNTFEKMGVTKDSVGSLKL